MLYNFYDILKLIVRHCPEGNKHYERLNSFAVIRSLQDLSTDNLSKSPDYLDSPYFYSRKQAHSGKQLVNYDYPACVIIPTNGTMRFPFSSKSEDCTEMLLSVVYPNLNKTNSTCNECEKLKVEQLFDEMSILLEYITSSLRDVGVYQNGAELLYMPNKIMEAFNAKGQYLTAEYDLTRSGLFQKYLQQNNGNLEIRYHDDIGIDNLCGVEVRLQFCECKEKSYSVDLDLVNCCG